MSRSTHADATPSWSVHDLLHEFEALSEAEQEAFLLEIIPGRIERVMHLIAQVARRQMER